MEDISQDHLNVTWNVLRELLCNRTIINTYRLNVTCEPSNRNESVDRNGDDGLSPDVLKVVIIACVIFLVGIFFNIVLIVTASNNKRFRKSSWKYITNVAVADILCMISIAVFVYFLLAKPKNWSRYLIPSLDIFISSASMLAVAAIALDRVNTVRSIEKQVSSLFHTRPNVVVASIWGYSVAIFVLALFRISVERLNDFVFWIATVVTFFGAVMVTITCYIIITCYYIKYTFLSNRLIKTPVNHLWREDEVDGMNIVREQKKKQKQVTKAFLTAITPLPFILGWSFFLGTQAYEILGGTYITNTDYNIAMIIVPWLVSALNPVFFMLLTTSIRKQIKTSLSRLLGLSIQKTKNYDETIYLTELYVENN